MTSKRAQDFFSLTPDRVLDAVEGAGLVPRPICMALNSYENRVYLVELAEGERRRVVAKFYRPGRWSDAQIAEEHRFLEELGGAEVPVCAVLRFPDGQTLRRTPAGIAYALFEYRPGRQLEDVDDALLERLGMMAARIHAVGARRAAPGRRRMDGDTFVRSALRWLRANDTLPRSVAARYERAALRLADLLDQRLDGVAIQRVHGDLHRGNLLMDHDTGGLHILDLDDMVMGPVVQDLWMMLSGPPAERSRQLALVLEGYRRFKPFDTRELRLVEPLRGLRRVHYATWVARRWQDPVFPATWPQAAEADYWHREASDLEAILAECEGESLAPSESTGASGGAREGWHEGLTNADYFWDLD